MLALLTLRSGSIFFQADDDGAEGEEKGGGDSPKRGGKRGAGPAPAGRELAIRASEEPKRQERVQRKRGRPGRAEGTQLGYLGPRAPTGRAARPPGAAASAWSWGRGRRKRRGEEQERDGRDHCLRRGTSAPPSCAGKWYGPQRSGAASERGGCSQAAAAPSVCTALGAGRPQLRAAPVVSGAAGAPGSLLESRRLLLYFSFFFTLENMWRRQQQSLPRPEEGC